MKISLIRLTLYRFMLGLLGVEQLVKDAFIEGYSMQGDNYERYPGGEVYYHPTWNSVDEAWHNSDAQERFE